MLQRFNIWLNYKKKLERIWILEEIWIKKQISYRLCFLNLVDNYKCLIVTKGSNRCISSCRNVDAEAGKRCIYSDLSTQVLKLTFDTWPLFNANTLQSVWANLDIVFPYISSSLRSHFLIKDARSFIKFYLLRSEGDPKF